MKTFLATLMFGALLLGGAFITAEPAAKLPAAPRHGRGRKAPSAAVLKARHDAALKRHGLRVASLPRTTAASFDCRTAFGCVLPVDDQGQCGDCYGVSAADGCSMALVKGGFLPNDPSKGRLSSQYGLDNPSAFVGGCDGGDEYQVIEFIATNGFPLTSDYGPYTAAPGKLKPLTGMGIYKISSYGYCTPAQQQGVAATQDMKNCMVQYGPISTAVDASAFDAYVWPGTIVGNGSNVDHAVLNIGWDDNHDNGDGTKGAFLGMNQWGSTWGGPNGTFWIKYGSYSWGTEAAWMTTSALPPPPPPPPPAPPPTPPPPPPDPASSVGTLALTTNLSKGAYPTYVMSRGQLYPAGTLSVATGGAPAGNYALQAPVSVKVPAP